MRNILILLLGAVFLTGCAHNYDLTLVNGMKITRVSKPKLDKTTGVYTYTNIKGEKKEISASRVIQIAPHSNSVKGPIPQ